MSEPRETASEVEEVVEGLYHWRIHNSAIGGNVSSSHALATGDACVLVDPVRLAEDAMASLPRPTAIVLTARCHQRAAWRYRRELGIEVWLPEDASAADEEPERRYADGDVLPGGLVAVRTPGTRRSASSPTVTWSQVTSIRRASAGFTRGRCVRSSGSPHTTSFDM